MNNLQRRLRAWSLVCMASALVILPVVIGDGYLSGVARGSLVASMAVLVGIYLTLRMAIGSSYRNTEVGPPVLPGRYEQLEQILFAKSLARNRYSRSYIFYFTNFLHDQRFYRSAEEHVSLIDDRALSVTTVLTLGLPSQMFTMVTSPPDNVVVPLIHLRRGTMLEDLIIRDAAGERLAVAEYAEIQGMLAFAIDILYRRAVLGTGPATLMTLAPHYEGALGHLTLLACGQGVLDDQVIDDCIRRVNNLLGSVPIADRPRLEALKWLCAYLGKFYVIGVRLPLELLRTDTVIEYSRTVPVKSAVVAKAEWVRSMVGLTTNVTAVPVSWPFVVPHYRFSLQARATQYVAQHSLFDLVSGGYVKQDDYDPPGHRPRPRPYIRLRKKRTLSSAQLLIRNLDVWPVRKLVTTVTVKEVPPGAMVPALIVALASAVLIVTFTIAQPGLKDGGSDTNSDIPALLLALPALAASLFGHSAERLREASFAAFASFGVALAASASAALIYVLDANQKRNVIPKDATIFGGAVDLPGTTLRWIALSVIALTTFFVILVRVVTSYREYHAVVATLDTN
ncbi:hypothetical protein OHA72_10170 [Dactylosporangium sp. NBC_01737]|uniref:hypothetical protein n=1 Tax=Dactylosporangium sp. NBC_01737 TaxID=2975959 RepID=UPI002E10CC6E|nr:hypothetical protein OHA72_10170 [Dactylosporangium sp. NBC_01737]